MGFPGLAEVLVETLLPVILNFLNSSFLAKLVSFDFPCKIYFVCPEQGVKSVHDCKFLAIVNL